MDAAIQSLAERLADLNARDAALADTYSLSPDARLQLAWALKDLCIATWTSAPTRARDGAEALEKVFAADPRPEIGALRDWGLTVSHLSLGDMEAAAISGASAAAYFDEVGERSNAAQVGVARVMALAQLGRIDEAKRVAHSSRTTFVELREYRLAGKTEINLGSLLLQQDRYDEAIAIYKQASVHCARAGDVELSIISDIAMSNALSDIGKFEEALLICERGRTRAQRAGLADTVGYANQSLGLIETLRGNLDGALRSYEFARSTYAQIGDARLVNECERDIADVYLQLGLYPEAIATYDRVLQGLRHGGSRTELAWALVKQAEAQLRSDAQHAASSSAVESEAVFRELDKPFGIVAALLLRAEIAIAENKLETADGALAQAAVECARFQSPAAQAALHDLAIKLHLRRSRPVAAKEALATLGVLVAESGNRVYELSRFNGLAAVAEAEGDSPLARVLYAQAIECFQTLHTALPSGEMKIGFRAKAKHAFDRLVVLSAQTEDAATLMAAMERGRADYRVESTDRTEIPDDTTAQRIRMLRARLNKAYRLSSRPDEDEADDDSDASHDVREMENELLDLARRQRVRGLASSVENNLTLSSSPRQNAGKPTTQHENDVREKISHDPSSQGFDSQGLLTEVRDLDDLSQLQSALAADDALVAFYLVESNVYACVVTREVAHAHIISAPQLDRLVTRARNQIETLRGTHTHLQRHADFLLRRADHYLGAIGDMLFAPLIDALAGARRLLLVPHAILHYVPFAALRVQSVPLVDRFDVVTLPAASAALGSVRGSRKADETVRIAPQSNALLVGSTHGHLAHVAGEVRALNALIPQSRSLVDGEATLERVLSAMPVAEYIHLACHGQFRADSPQFSALHFADGALTVRDISEMKLRARLVTLSACETGLSQLSPGDELLGLTRTLMHAGAERVLTSLWAVDDAATATLMQHFYRRLMQGMRASQALRESQRELRDGNPQWRHPYFWAAFTLTGRP
jgi:CHAT domain-containing protein/tetratricopeptide (TPR) repeat protein